MGNLYFTFFLKKWGYTGLHLSVHPAVLLSSVFYSLHKAIYIISTTAGVKSDFLTVLVLFHLAVALVKGTYESLLIAL